MSSRLLFASVLVLSADAAFLAPGASRVASRHRVAAAPSMTAEISKDTVDSLEVHILFFFNLHCRILFYSLTFTRSLSFLVQAEFESVKAASVVAADLAPAIEEMASPKANKVGLWKRAKSLVGLRKDLREASADLLDDQCDIDEH